MSYDKIVMAHGSGGEATHRLIDEVFASEFDSEILYAMEDAALLPVNAKNDLVMTTDSFVADPVIFKGGDLGRLSVCGTVNDLLMRGAKPLYISSAWILEEGADISTLKALVESMADTAKEAGVQVVCGDTKVIEGSGGIYVNTTGIGTLYKKDKESVNISASLLEPGDAVIVSGNLGDHHAAILSERMSIDNDIKSDVAPLVLMVERLVCSLPVHALRDVTRGGLATVCRELGLSSGVTIELEEGSIPVDGAVRDFSKLLGLDPLYMGNEGKLVCVLPKEYAGEAVSIMRESKYGADACVIGRVTDDEPNELILNTSIGGKRILDILKGEGLPRIC